MAHFLDNDWKITIIQFPPGGDPTASPDGTIHLMHTGNRLNATSRHGANEIEGTSTPDGGGFELRFTEKVPAGSGAFRFRPYTGSLMDHKIIGGVEHKVIGGFRGRLLERAPKDEDFNLRSAFGQNDGVWIGTQP